MTFVPDILDGSPNLADRVTQPVLFWVYLVFMNGVGGFMGLDCGVCARSVAESRSINSPNPKPKTPNPTNHKVWVLIPLLLLWESGAHVTHACALAKTEHQPQRSKIPGLPAVAWFQLVAGALRM